MTPEQEKHLRMAFRLAGPKVRRHLRFLLAETEVEVRGCKFFVHPRDNFTERHLWAHLEPPELQSLNALERLAVGKRVLFLDVGANCGVFTVPLAKQVADGSRVMAFEPNPTMLARLTKNLALNQLADRVEVMPFALGAAEGEATLRLHAGNLGQSSLKALQPGMQASEVTVRLKPLDQFLQNADDYDLCILKIDVEGFEDSVLGEWLKGANTHGDKPDAILIETAHAGKWNVDLISGLKRLGYAASFKGEGNTLFLLKKGRAEVPLKLRVFG